MLEQSFVGAVVFPLAGAILAGVAFAVTAYVTFLSSVHLTPMLLSLVLATFLVVGALAAMLSASDPQWWKMNLSALGMSDEASALAFNITLIVAGAMVTIIARYATASLPTTTRQELRGRNLLRVGLILIGIFLACVGDLPGRRVLRGAQHGGDRHGGDLRRDRGRACAGSCPRCRGSSSCSATSSSA